MGVVKLGVLFDSDEARLGREILSGTQKILFVEGDFSLKPRDGILMIVEDDRPTAALIVVGKIGLLPMTANEAKRIEAVVPTQSHNGCGGIEVKIFTEIHIGDIEVLPMSKLEVVDRKYADGSLKDE